MVPLALPSRRLPPREFSDWKRSVLAGKEPLFGLPSWTLPAPSSSATECTGTGDSQLHQRFHLRTWKRTVVFTGSCKAVYLYPTQDHHRPGAEVWGTLPQRCQSLRPSSWVSRSCPRLWWLSWCFRALNLLISYVGNHKFASGCLVKRMHNICYKSLGRLYDESKSCYIERSTFVLLKSFDKSLSSCALLNYLKMVRYAPSV